MLVKLDEVVFGFFLVCIIVGFEVCVLVRYNFIGVELESMIFDFFDDFKFMFIFVGDYIIDYS